MPTPEVSTVDAGPRAVSRRTQVAAPVAELFALVADPRRHGELDGSGTVLDVASGPDRLAPDAKFSVRMKMHGVPYRITSRVTAFEENRIVEWRHPAGHRWRWEFEELGPDLTQVTETWDYSGSALGGLGYRLMSFPAANAKGITETLNRLRARYPAAH